MERYHEANKRLTLAGHLVYSVCMVSTGAPGAREDITTHDKEWLDLVHLKKIQESDAVVVIGVRKGDPDNYVGESTRREARWAAMLGKDMLMESGVEGLCRGKESPRYNLLIPGHVDKEWEHDCMRDGHGGRPDVSGDDLGILAALFAARTPPRDESDPETRPA